MTAGDAGARPGRLRVGAVQLISDPHDVEGNVARALAYCDRAAARRVRILCFPECATTGFDWLQDPREVERVHAEPVPGPLVERFADKARQTDLYIIMGMVEQAGWAPRRSTTPPSWSARGRGTSGATARCWPRRSSRPAPRRRSSRRATARSASSSVPTCAPRAGPAAGAAGRPGAPPAHQLLPPRRVGGADARRRDLGKRAAQRARAMDNGLPLVVANAGRPEYVNNSRVLGPHPQGPEPVLARHAQGAAPGRRRRGRRGREPG